MNTFGFYQHSDINLLPIDGKVRYFGGVLDPKKLEVYFSYLEKNLEWKQDQIKVFNKTRVTDRKVAWYGDSPFLYSYSGDSKVAIPWDPILFEIKDITETIISTKFNSCLCNYYPGGLVGMAYHSDDESTLQENAPIASISLGAERKFLFKHKTKNLRTSIFLENGSLLLMEGNTQKNWKHSLPKTRRVISPRINLTFRIFKK